MNNVKWELNSGNLGVVVAPHAFKLLPEPIAQWDEHWCEVTVNGLDTMGAPTSVVNFAGPKTQKCKYRLAQQVTKGMGPTSSHTI